MRYMMFIKHTEEIRVEDVPPALMAAMGEFVGEGMKNGTIVDTAGLKPTKDGTRVRLTGGKIKVIDGPLTETKEIVGGYAIIEAASNADAVEAAKKFMELHRAH